jgi:AcrR family transcriptional regulator
METSAPSVSGLRPARRPSERRGSDTKGDRREQGILDALEALLLEAPFAKLSVGQIAERAGVGRTAFYFYFASREAALAALAERSMEPLYEAGGGWLFGEGDPVPAMREGLQRVVQVWTNQAHLLVALIDAASHDPDMLDMWRTQIEEMAGAVTRRIERDAERGLTWPNIRAADIARTLVWMSERYCYMYLSERPWSHPSDEVHASLLHLWEHAIYQSAGEKRA